MNLIQQHLNQQQQPNLAQQVAQMKQQLNGQDPKSVVMQMIQNGNVSKDTLRNLINQTNSIYNGK